MSTTNITLQISQPDPLEIAKITPFFPTETQGEPGETPMLRMLAQALQWKYVSEGNGAYQTLFDFDDLELPISQIIDLQTALNAKLPTSYVPAWADISGKPSTFTPSTHAHAIADTTGLQTALDAKAAQATTYTKTETDTNISVAIANLINAAPGALDTLDELAAAMGDDPNFAATIVSSLGNKVSLTGSYADPTWVTSLAASKIDQSASYRFVTDTEKTTWNAKQNAITNPVTGTGTNGFVMRWNSGLAANSSIRDNGTQTAIGGNVDTSYLLRNYGATLLNGSLNLTSAGGDITNGIASGQNPAIFITTTTNSWADLFSFGEGGRVGVLRGFQNGGNTILFKFSGLNNGGSFFDYVQIQGQSNSLSSGGLRVYLTTASTNTSTGSLITDGGFGAAGNINGGGYIKTATPSANGAGAWKLGKLIGSDGTGATSYLELDIDGVVYILTAKVK